MEKYDDVLGSTEPTQPAEEVAHSTDEVREEAVQRIDVASEAEAEDKEALASSTARKLGQAAEVLARNDDDVAGFLATLTQDELNKVFSIASRTLDLAPAIRAIQQKGIRQATREDRKKVAAKLGKERDDAICELVGLDRAEQDDADKMVAWRYFFRTHATEIFHRTEQLLHPPEERPRDARERQFKD